MFAQNDPCGASHRPALQIILYVNLVEQNVTALSLGWGNRTLICFFVWDPVRWETFMKKQKYPGARAAKTDSVCDLSCMG